MDRIEALKSVVVDLLPEIAEWNRRNFPESGHFHKAMGVAEEVGELMHAILKGLQGIRHTPDEIATMIGDAFADTGVYVVALIADAGSLAGENMGRIVTETGRLIEIDTKIAGEVHGWRESEGPTPSLHDAAFVACEIFEDASRVLGSSRSLEEVRKARLRIAVQADLVCRQSVSLIVSLDTMAWNGFGLDFPTLLRETWAKVVAKRDWRADPMGAAEVAG